MGSRDRILSKIIDEKTPLWDRESVRGLPVFGDDGKALNKTEKFITEAGKISVSVFEYENKSELTKILNKIVAENNLKVINSFTELKELIDETEIPKVFFDRYSAEFYRAIPEIKSFIEKCNLGCYDTSTLFFWENEMNSNHQSLYPEIHIVLIEERDLYSFHECMEKLKALTGQYQNITAITGASRTADIEKILVLGVHGPKKIIVIVKKEN